MCFELVLFNMYIIRRCTNEYKCDLFKYLIEILNLFIKSGIKVLALGQYIIIIYFNLLTVFKFKSTISHMPKFPITCQRVLISLTTQNAAITALYLRTLIIVVKCIFQMCDTHKI